MESNIRRTTFGLALAACLVTPLLTQCGGGLPNVPGVDIPGAGKLTLPELKAISQKSCGVIRGIGPQIQWLHSYVTGDKIYCVYIAPDEATVRKHAELGGFPANRVSAVTGIIDPTTAE